MLLVKSPAELLQEEIAQARVNADIAMNLPVVSSLAAYVRSCWDAAKQAKEPIQQEMLSALRRRNNQYDPDKEAEFARRGITQAIFMGLTDEKCAGAESYLYEILFPPDERPWGIKPTPMPELQPQQMQMIHDQINMELQQFLQLAGPEGLPIPVDMVRNRIAQLISKAEEEIGKYARQMNDKIEIKLDDILSESGWYEALSALVWDFVTFKACFLKGPVLKKKPTLEWDQMGNAVAQDSIVMEWESPSPLDIYPAPSSNKIGDSYLIERHRLTRSDFIAMQGIEGYNQDAIKTILAEMSYGTIQETLSTPDDGQPVRGAIGLNNSLITDPEGKTNALQFWGPVQGLKLLEYGIDRREIEDPFKEYHAEVWLVGNAVIKTLLNSDPLGRIPYYKASFREVKGMFWGKGVPDIIKDIQDMGNATARNLVSNLSIASGPQVGIDISQLAQGEKITQMFPWKIWQLDTSRTATHKPPLSFWQPELHADALLKIYEFFSMEADNKLGVPRYAYGAPASPGTNRAINTATGLSMMMNNSSRGIKRVLQNLDLNVIAESVKRLHEWLMLYRQDPILMQGDIKIIARGSQALVAREAQQVRRNEFLQLISNPMLAQIVGLPAIAETARKVATGLDIDLKDLIPTKEEMYMNMMTMQAQQQQQGGDEKPKQLSQGKEEGNNTRAFDA